MRNKDKAVEDEKKTPGRYWKNNDIMMYAMHNNNKFTSAKNLREQRGGQFLIWPKPNESAWRLCGLSIRLMAEVLEH